MHGDDVASAGVNVSSQVALKTTEVLIDLLKFSIEKKIEKQRNKKEQVLLPGGEVTYQKLKKGGEITMLPNFARDDYIHLIKKAKEMDIPIMGTREKNKENTLSLFFNVKDKEAVNSIVQDIVREKLKSPNQTERMITIKKEQVESFQMYCSDYDIPTNFMESKDGVKCIFSSAYEKQMEIAVENFKKFCDELKKITIQVNKDDKGKLKITVEDLEQGKKLTMNFCTKAKLERVLDERLGYSQVKKVELANTLTSKLSDEQRGYYLSGSRQLEQMDYYENDIKFENENILTGKFSFAKMKFQEDDTPRLTITDERGNFVVISAKAGDRTEAEESIKRHLKVEDTETIKAIMAKAERLGFIKAPQMVQFNEYIIERETQLAYTVRGGSTIVRLDLSDNETSKKQLMDSFGMTSTKAEKIIDKAQKQVVSINLLKKAREKTEHIADALTYKKLDRGSRK